MGGGGAGFIKQGQSDNERDIIARRQEFSMYVNLMIGSLGR